MKKAFASLLLAALLVSGCSQQTETADPVAAAPATEAVSTTVLAMDTVMDLSIYGDEALLTQAEETIAQLEACLSVTEETSEIYALNQAGQGTLSPVASQLLEEGLALCERTGGALDLSIYPVLRLWGFTTGDYRVPGQEEIAALLAHVDYRDIHLDPDTGNVTLAQGMQIDLGSIAKGYTGDCLSQLFKEGGVTSGLVNLGGNVQAIGAKPDGSAWRVGIQDPASAETLAVVEVVDQAVITSGGYERYFEADGQTYWHILDPDTGAPARSGLLSATIVGSSGLVCDGLSTALFVMGVEEAAELWRSQGDFEAVLVAEDGTIYITAGLEDCFSLTEAAAGCTLEVIR